MAQFVLNNDVNVLGTRIRAGKLIDSNQYDVAKLRAAGAILVPATAAAIARAATLAKAIRGGNYPTMETATLLSEVQPAISPLPGGYERVAASQSPYAVKANTKVVVDCSGGNVVLNLPKLADQEFATVKHDEKTSFGGNSITVNSDSTQTLAEPPPNNGTFVSAFVISGAQSAGTELTWTNLGAANGGLSVE